MKLLIFQVKCGFWISGIIPIINTIQNQTSRDTHEGFGQAFPILFHTNLKQISVCIVHKLSLDECPRQKRAISRILNKLQLKCGEIMKFNQNFLKIVKIAVRETLFSEACII